MRRYVVWGWLTLLLAIGLRSRAQSFEAEQLLLDWQKLSQEKQILQDLYNGYTILSKGYGAIRDLSKGSFDLHKAFLDGLLSVSPTVKTYKRVADIIRLQEQIVSQYRSAWGLIRQDEHFTPDEVGFIGNVYTGLFDRSVRNLTDLAQLLTDGVYRASDAERLEEIDGLYRQMQGNQVFLMAFTDRTELLALQRGADASDYEVVRGWYGLNG
ncbi:MAG TPA: hypothetical protein VKQ52_16675 [Puia sp.]|nr:hypothetical protein [Puia sp.]